MGSCPSDILQHVSTLIRTTGMITVTVKTSSTHYEGVQLESIQWLHVHVVLQGLLDEPIS